MILTKIMIGYFLGINILTLLLYGLDKWKAKKNRWRIPEKTLLGTALIGGSLGALVGMQVFRHKTKHWSFKICVPAFFVLHMALLFIYISR